MSGYKVVTRYSWLLVLCTALACARPDGQLQEGVRPRVVTTDVANFWNAYDSLARASSPEDSIRIIERLYLDRGSPGLNAFVRARVDDAADLLMAVRMLPRYLSSVRPTMLGLDRFEGSVRTVFEAVSRLYPAANHPDVYFVYGGMVSMGVPTDTGLIIGAEMVSADPSTPTDELPPAFAGVDLTTGVLPCVVAHELIHYQQDYGEGRRLLKQVISEGVADFLAELAVGCHQTAQPVYRYGEQHEAELWVQFNADLADPEDVSGWLYNGMSVTGVPANLGYWLGYKVAEAYYDSSANKSEAIRMMLTIRDFDEFLEASGYDGS